MVNIVLSAARKNENFIWYLTGAGMDIDMLHDFGEKQIAISCPQQSGYLVLKLTKAAIKEISKGKIGDLNEVAVAEVPESLRGKDVQEYLNNHKGKIRVKIHKSCTAPPAISLVFPNT